MKKPAIVFVLLLVCSISFQSFTAKKDGGIRKDMQDYLQYKLKPDSIVVENATRVRLRNLFRNEEGEKILLEMRSFEDSIRQDFENLFYKNREKLDFYTEFSLRWTLKSMKRKRGGNKFLHYFLEVFPNKREDIVYKLKPFLKDDYYKLELFDAKYKSGYDRIIKELINRMNFGWICATTFPDHDFLKTRFVKVKYKSKGKHYCVIVAEENICRAMGSVYSIAINPAECKK